MEHENQVNGGYPQAIIHVDGDGFFASCELTRRPDLRGKPVVVGGTRGIALAMTPEAKKLGIVRGMPAFQIKQLYPSAIILPGDYDLYEQYATRMYAIVHRYSTVVEEYSVDECFADITNHSKVNTEVEPQYYEEVARKIKYDLESELGVSFSVGLATTKVLAKVGSKHNKPSGLVYIPQGSERGFLTDLAVGKVWGIGRATAEMLYQRGINTAQQFVDQPEWWVKESLAKPHRTIWAELQGKAVYVVDPDSHAEQKSIASTRTFRPTSTDKAVVLSQLSKNIEDACSRARVRGLAARHVYCFLKSQEFQYRRFELQLLSATNIPTDILAAVAPLFEKYFVQGILYRATGITLSDIVPAAMIQNDLFGSSAKAEQAEALYRTLDTLGHKYGPRVVHLASSHNALKGRAPEVPHLSIPFLGDVR